VNMRKAILSHPVMVAIIPILFLYAHNIRYYRINPVDMLFPGIASLAFLSVSYLILRLFVKSNETLAMLLSSIMFFLLTSGQISTYILTYVSWYRNRYFLAFIATCFFVFLRYVSKHERFVYMCNTFIFVVSSYLLLVNAAHAIIHSRSTDTLTETPTGQGNEFYPNIYHIIPDAYGRHDVLLEHYDYDNTWFLDSLRTMGFFVADSALANYGTTIWSLGSTLNMCYLDSIADAVGRDSKDIGPLVAFLNYNRVTSFLTSRGYNTICIESGYTATEFRHFDLYAGAGWLTSEFILTLYHASILNIFYENYMKNFAYTTHRNRIDFAFQNLPSIGSSEYSPFYVFAHIMSPHPPFVYDADGGHVEISGSPHLSDYGAESRYEYVDAYIGQLRFTENALLSVIREVMDATHPPVIVLHSDHGPSSYFSENNQLSPVYVQEHYPILLAVYIPDSQYSHFYPSMSLVNLFTVIYNDLFNASFSILPDECYSIHPGSPYKFLLVSNTP